MTYSYTKPTLEEIKKHEEIKQGKNQRIIKLFSDVLMKDIKVEDLEINDWKQLIEDLKNRGASHHEAIDLYGWWLGRKYWLVDQKTEQKYNPGIIVLC